MTTLESLPSYVYFIVDPVGRLFDSGAAFADPQGAKKHFCKQMFGEHFPYQSVDEVDRFWINALTNQYKIIKAEVRYQLASNRLGDGK